MSNGYDKKGNYIGQTDSKGNHWDKNGSYAGQTDSKGNHWDKNGSYAGQTDAKGNHWDKNGSYAGQTDANGNSWDKNGSYAGKNNWSGNDRDSSSGNGGGLEILLAIIWLATAAIGIATVASPIIAPILLTTVENARKKGDFAYVKKWESLSVLASVVAVLVVLVAAGAISFEIATSILGFTASSTSSILTEFIFIAAIIFGIASFVFLFITGISPTALIYLKNKELHLLASGEIVKAQKLRQYSSLIKTTTISTVISIIAIFIIIPLASSTTRWASNKIQASVFSPPTAVQSLPIVTEPVQTIFATTPTLIPTARVGIPFVSTESPTQQSLDITGMWDMTFSDSGYTNSNGVFTNRTAIESWSVNLQQSGNNLTGELLSVNSKYTDTCENATIEGSINDFEFSILVYFHGNCCPNEIIRIDGEIEIENENNIIGIYQPEKIPSGTCTLSTGDMIGTKR